MNGAHLSPSPAEASKPQRSDTHVSLYEASLTTGSALEGIHSPHDDHVVLALDASLSNLRRGGTQAIADGDCRPRASAINS